MVYSQTVESRVHSAQAYVEMWISDSWEVKQIVNEEVPIK